MTSFKHRTYLVLFGQPSIMFCTDRALNANHFKFSYFCNSGPNPNHQKLKNLDPTQPKPWVNPTHGQLWYRGLGAYREKFYFETFEMTAVNLSATQQLQHDKNAEIQSRTHRIDRLLLTVGLQSSHSRPIKYPGFRHFRWNPSNHCPIWVTLAHPKIRQS